MRLFAIGRMRPGPEADLFARYNQRLRPALAVTELPDGHGAPAEIRRRESAAMLAALPAETFAIALDMDAPARSSEELAHSLATWQASGRPVAFVIGGPEGLGRAVLDRMQAGISLGRLTWPHLLVRAMLVEQLYRVQSIKDGHPYHKAGRPGG